MRHDAFKSCPPWPFFVLSALATIAPLSHLCGQKPPAAGSQYTFHSEVDLLSVAVRVTDRNDNEIHGLTANQFSVYEDGKPQKIAFFDAEDEPVSLGILLDVSGSMKASGKLAQAKTLCFASSARCGPQMKSFTCGSMLR
jgi:hypothetical protein